MTALIIIGALVVIVLVHVVRLWHRASSRHFDCPDCATSFQVSFTRYMFTSHGFDGSCNVTCPECGHTSMLPSLPGSVTR